MVEQPEAVGDEESAAATEPTDVEASPPSDPPAELERPTELPAPVEDDGEAPIEKTHEIPKIFS